MRQRSADSRTDPRSVQLSRIKLDGQDMANTQSASAKDASAVTRKGSIETRIRQVFLQKNLDLVVVIILSCYHHCRTVSAETEQSMSVSGSANLAPFDGRVLAEEHSDSAYPEGDTHGGHGHTSDEDGASIYSEEERASYT